MTGDWSTLDPVETADVVQAKDVIGVAVREEDGVDAFDSGGQHLLPEVRRGVDHDRGAARHVDVDGRPQPLVARIRRSAHLAGAADHRHT